MKNNKSMRDLLIVGIGVSVLFLLVPVLSFGATYYVTVTGSDRTGDGSKGNPWLTIQKCANTAVAGDTCNIGAGSYGSSGSPVSITSHASGSAGNLITFQGAGASSTTLWGQWTITHDYNKITGFKIDSKDINVAYTDTILISGDYNQIISNTITSTKAADSILYVRGINTTSASSYATVSGNIFSNHNYLSALIQGDHHTFSGNEWIGRATHVRGGCNFPAYDRAYIFGSYYTEDGETIHDWDGGDCVSGAPHMDIWQSFTGGGAYNVIKNDVVYNLFGAAQLGNFDGTGTTLHDWTWYNNVIYNATHGTMNVYNGTRFKWYNNLFYNVGYVSGGHVLLYNAATGASEGVINGNMFIGCGRPDREATYGYYGGTGYTGDYNYVTRSAANSYGAKTGTNVGGVHGINGGNPKFNNVTTYDFHIASNSPAKDAFPRSVAPTGVFNTDHDGITRPIGAAWDIGPYEEGDVGGRPPSPSPPKNLRTY